MFFPVVEEFAVLLTIASVLALCWRTCIYMFLAFKNERKRERLCVCVCVCVRERERVRQTDRQRQRERERQTDTDRENLNQNICSGTSDTYINQIILLVNHAVSLDAGILLFCFCSIPTHFSFHVGCFGLEKPNIQKQNNERKIKQHFSVAGV